MRTFRCGGHWQTAHGPPTESPRQRTQTTKGGAVRQARAESEGSLLERSRGRIRAALQRGGHLPEGTPGRSCSLSRRRLSRRCPISNSLALEPGSRHSLVRWFGFIALVLLLWPNLSVVQAQTTPFQHRWAGLVFDSFTLDG